MLDQAVNLVYMEVFVDLCLNAPLHFRLFKMVSYRNMNSFFHVSFKCIFIATMDHLLMYYNKWNLRETMHSNAVGTT